MGTIVARKRQDGSAYYTGQTVIKSKGKVHREARSFDRRQLANAWLVRREEEFAALDRTGKDPKLADVIAGRRSEHRYHQHADHRAELSITCGAAKLKPASSPSHLGLRNALHEAHGADSKTAALGNKSRHPARNELFGVSPTSLDVRLWPRMANIRLTLRHGVLQHDHHPIGSLRMDWRREKQNGHPRQDGDHQEQKGDAEHATEPPRAREERPTDISCRDF
jgi:hypothetical protein